MYNEDGNIVKCTFVDVFHYFSSAHVALCGLKKMSALTQKENAEFSPLEKPRVPHVSPEKPSAVHFLFTLRAPKAYRHIFRHKRHSQTLWVTITE